MKGRIWTVPNQITFLRLGFLPFFLILIFYEKYAWALLVLVIAWWLTILVISRDVLLLVVAAVILIIQGYRPFPPSLLGKATTFFEIALVFFTLYDAAYPNDRVDILLRYLAFTVSAFVIISGFHYAVTVARRLHHSG